MSDRTPWWKRLFRGKDEPRLVRVEMSEEQIREKLKGDRDFRLRATPEGAVSAHCKACDEGIDMVAREPLLWFRCPTCRRQSFYPMANLQRDVHFAQTDGVPFEYEVFYLQDLPPGLESPFKQ